jgi:hypothetical protein
MKENILSAFGGQDVFFWSKQLFSQLRIPQQILTKKRNKQMRESFQFNIYLISN